MVSQADTWYSTERRYGTRRVFLAVLAAALLFSMLAPPVTSPAQAAVGGGRSIEVFYERDLVLISEYPANTSVTIEVLRGGQTVGSVTGTTDAAGALEINHTGENDCWDLPFTPDIQPGDEVRTSFQDASGAVTDSTVARDVAIDFDATAFDDVEGTITVKGNVNSLQDAPIDVNADILEFRMNKNNRDNPWGDNADPGSRRDLRAQIAPADISADGSFTHVFSGLAPEDVADARDNGVSQTLLWSQTPANEGDVIPESTIFDEFEGVPPGCPPHEVPRDGGAIDNAVPNVHEALAGELPAPGVDEGRTLEVFHGIEFVGLTNYPQNADVRVDVVREGVVTGSTTQKTDAAGVLEINHLGEGQFPAGDCWAPGATPDIRPGDTVLATVLDKAGNDTADVDSTVVRDVELYTDQTQVGANTITLRGHVRDLPNAQIDEANDVLELRLNANGFTWNQSNGGRKDLRAQVPASAINADGTFEYVFDVSAAEAQNAASLGFEQGIEWSPAVVEPAEASEITVFDGADMETVGCPPRLAPDASAITSSSHPFINGANGSAAELELGGVTSGATSGISVSIVQEQDGQRNVIATAPAQLSESGKTWSASIPMSELSNLAEGRFDAEAAFTGTAVGTDPAPVSWATGAMMKDTAAPAAPAVPADGPQPGTYNVAQQVPLSSEEGAKVYYTTDGSDPADANNATRQLYSAPIAVDATQTIRAVALDRAGNASPVAEFAYTIVAADTQLTLNARPATIDYGSAGNITLSGKLASDGAGVAEKQVILERRPAGATNWGRAGTAKTATDDAATAADESGNFSLAVPRPDRNTEYRARFVSAEGLKASQATDTVNVRVLLSLTGLPGQAPGTQVQLGRAVSITGTVQPAHGGRVTITVERKNAAGNFVQFATANRALKDSAYRYGYKAGQRGEYRMRVSFAGDADHAGDTSRYGYFNVVPRAR